MQLMIISGVSFFIFTMLIVLKVASKVAEKLGYIFKLNSGCQRIILLNCIHISKPFLRIW